MRRGWEKDSDDYTKGENGNSIKHSQNHAGLEIADLAGDSLPHSPGVFQFLCESHTR
jgi:hypothetical protein